MMHAPAEDKGEGLAVKKQLESQEQRSVVIKQPNSSDRVINYD